MFKLDNDFLVTMGLGNLPVDEKNRLLQMIYERLEMNVGMRLAEKMSDQQLDEFERFMDGDMVHARGFLDQTKPGWESSETYQTNLKNAKAEAEKRGTVANENGVISEFAALTWLEQNFPNYKDVVAEELEKLKGEVQAAAPQIIAAAQAPTQNGMPPVAQAPVMPGVPPASPAYPGGAPMPAQPMQPSYNYQSYPGYGQPAYQAPNMPQPSYGYQQPYQPQAGPMSQPPQMAQPMQPNYGYQPQPGYGQPPRPAAPAQAYGPLPASQAMPVNTTYSQSQSAPTFRPAPSFDQNQPQSPSQPTGSAQPVVPKASEPKDQL